MRTPLVLSPALAFGLLVLFSAGSPASAQVASDDAARTVYDNGWQTGDDGDASPNGFAAWTLSPGANTGNAGFFVGSSTNNNDSGPAFAQANGQSDVNTGGRAWALYANSNALAEATRSFNAPLAVGQTFSLWMDNGGLNNPGASTGFGLRNLAGQNLIEVFFREGTGDYRVKGGSGEVSTGLGFTRLGLRVQIAPTSFTTARVRIVRQDNGQVAQFDVPLSNPSGGQAIVQLRLFNFNAGGGDAANFYVNALRIDDPPSRTFGGVSGWRMIAPPVAGATVADLVSRTLVQGVPGEFEAAQTNLFTGFNGNNADFADPDGGGPLKPNNRGFTAPTGAGAPLALGRGFIWYLYAQAFDPDASNTNGSSASAGLPFTLALPGPRADASVSTAFTTAERASPDSTFFLLGNPFAQPFDLSGVSASSGVLSANFQFYDPGSGTYVVRTALENDAGNAADNAAVWDGFFAQVTGPKTFPLTFTYDAGFREGAAGKTDVAETPALRRLALVLDGALGGGAATHDEAAIVLFTDEATAGWDRYDASKLTPFGGTYATLAPVGAGADGAPEAKAVESRPSAARAVTVPLRFTATHAGAYSISAAPGALGDGWAVTLRDAATGAAADLQSGPYAFLAEAGSSDRFSVTVTPPAATANERDGLPGGFALSGVSPNPATARATFTLRLDAGQRVRADLYDALGRRVLVVYDGPLAPGAEHALALDGRALPAGTYALRVTGERFTATRTVVFVR